jgi:hypothetical protein
MARVPRAKLQDSQQQNQALADLPRENHSQRAEESAFIGSFILRANRPQRRSVLSECLNMGMPLGSNVEVNPRQFERKHSNEIQCIVRTGARGLSREEDCIECRNQM